jgi:hypothetical protein
MLRYMFQLQDGKCPVEDGSVSRQVLAAARATVRESRALVARARGKPYLAAKRGEPTNQIESARVGLQQPPAGKRQQG